MARFADEFQRNLPKAEWIVGSVTCPNCRLNLHREAFHCNLHICPHCDWHGHMAPLQRSEYLCDKGTYAPLGKLQSIKGLAGTDAPDQSVAVFAGTGTLNGKAAVVLSVDCTRLGAASSGNFENAVIYAFTRATARKLPVIVVFSNNDYPDAPQDSVLLSLRVAKAASAVERHRSAGLLHISLLADPILVGAIAGFASLADIVIAESRGMSPDWPEGLRKQGLIDLVVGRLQQREVVSLIVNLVASPQTCELPLGRLAPTRRPLISADSALRLARHPDRPRARDYIAKFLTTFIELDGDRSSGNDPAIVGGIGSFFGSSVLVIGHAGGVVPLAEGFRKIRRLLLLAGKFHLPVIFLVDAPGAFRGLEPGYYGLSQAMAETMTTLSSVEVPIISIVIGEGGSGGGLALSIADAVLMQENAVYSMISNDGAMALLLQDGEPEHVPVGALNLCAQDLLDFGLIDAIVPEPSGGAHLDPDSAATLLCEYLAEHLNRLTSATARSLLPSRTERVRSVDAFERGWLSTAHALMRNVSNTDL